MEGLTFEQTPSAPIGSQRKRSPKRFLYLLSAIAVIALLIFGAVKLLGGSKSETASITPTPTEIITETPMSTEIPTPTETPSLTPTATPTKTPTAVPSSNPVDSATGLDRSTLAVTVQNGSGVAGAAATAGDYLTGLGYNVVSTGNAATEDFTNVTIQVKSTKTNFLALLKKDLSSKYTVGITSADLASTSSADALVVIGK